MFHNIISVYRKCKNKKINTGGEMTESMVKEKKKKHEKLLVTNNDENRMLWRDEKKR